MKPYTYSLILFFTIIICFLFSFDNRIRFNRYFGAYLKAASIAAVPFIAWDIWFTDIGIWWFTKEYTLGYIFLGLPIEEWLFFFCIPFSCVFTYYCLTKFFDLNWANKYNAFASLLIIVISAAIMFLYQDKMYPFITSLTASFMMVYLHFIVKADWIGKATFVYLVLTPGFFAVNGILTGTGLESPIVNYNPEQIMNIRLATIPIEDSLYGYTQFVTVVYFFNKFKEHKPIEV